VTDKLTFDLWLMPDELTFDLGLRVCWCVFQRGEDRAAAGLQTGSGPHGAGSEETAAGSEASPHLSVFLCDSELHLIFVIVIASPNVSW